MHFLVKPFPYTTPHCQKLTSNMLKSKIFRMNDTDLCTMPTSNNIDILNKDQFIIKENYALFNVGIIPKKKRFYYKINLKDYNIQLLQINYRLFSKFRDSLLNHTNT